jgi:hypothetical protein
MNVTLEALKELVIANTNVKPTIQHVFIDYGTRWSEDTLVAPNKEGDFSYQMLSPRDVLKIKKGEFTDEDAQEFIDEINKRGW